MYVTAAPSLTQAQVPTGLGLSLAPPPPRLSFRHAAAWKPALGPALCSSPGPSCLTVRGARANPFPAMPASFPAGKISDLD